MNDAILQEYIKQTADRIPELTEDQNNVLVDRLHGWAFQLLELAVRLRTGGAAPNWHSEMAEYYRRLAEDIDDGSFQRRHMAGRL